MTAFRLGKAKGGDIDGLQFSPMLTDTEGDDVDGTYRHRIYQTIPSLTFPARLQTIQVFHNVVHSQNPGMEPLSHPALP